MKRLDQLSLSEADRSAIEAAAATLRQHLPVDQIILYGSKACGDDDPESDIDLLVLTKRTLTKEESHSVVELLYPFELQYGVALSSVEIPTSEWYEGVYQVLPFRVEVERDGVPI